MNILLVYPRYPDTFWSFKYALSFISKKAAYPPLGLLTVSSLLPKDWDKKLVDLNVSDLSDEDIAWADMVFISAMLVQKQNAQEIIDRCKKLDRTVVAGGPAFITQHKRFTGIDHLVLNEAEITLPLFLKDLEKGNPKPIYESDERPDISKTPAPDWSLINFKDYSTMTLQYSRGCPFDCEFCDIIIMNGRVPRTKTPEQMIGEFQSLYEAGWRGAVFVVDDNFIGNTANVKKFLPVLIDWQKHHKYPFKLITEASTNLADDEELMQMMSAANFYNVFLGIETPDVDGLKECGKVQNTTRDLAESVKIIQKNGMQVMGGFIVGFDTDTESIFEAQIKFIQKLGIVTAMVGVLTALPKTRLWHRLKSEGRLLKETSGENTDGTLNFMPKMGKDKLVDGYKQIISRIYSPKNYYRRINTFLKNYKHTVKGKPSFNHYMAGLKSIWKIGILSSSRSLYWKLFFKTLFTRVKLLPLAIEFSICGQHFEEITKQTLDRKT